MTKTLKQSLMNAELAISEYVKHHGKQDKNAALAVLAYQELVREITTHKTTRLSEFR